MYQKMFFRLSDRGSKTGEQEFWGVLLSLLAYLGKTSLPLPTTPESGEGRRAWRWTKDGRRQGAKHSSFPASAPLLRAVHLPLGKYDIFACRESRLFRKRGRTRLVPAQRSERQPMAEVGSLQRLPLLSRLGGHCPHSCRCGTTRMPAVTSSPPQAARATVCLWGLGLVPWWGVVLLQAYAPLWISGCGPAGMWQSHHLGSPPPAGVQALP